MASASRRPKLWALVIGLLVVASPALVVSLPASTRSETSCTALRAWAQGYAGRSFTLDELASYDRAHRRAIFSVMTPEAQAAAWREQIRRLGEQSDLTAEQRALTAEGIELLTPALYRHEPQATAAFQAFRQRVDRAFITAAHQRVWRDLGALSGTGSSTARSDTDFCNCKVGGGTGQCGGVFCGNGGGCEAIQACGFSGLEICDGMCQW